MGRQPDLGGKRNRDNCFVREGSGGGAWLGVWFGVWEQRGGPGSLLASGGLLAQSRLGCCCCGSEIRDRCHGAPEKGCPGGTRVASYTGNGDWRLELV